MTLRTVADVASGADLPARTFTLTRADLRTYADSVGDPNPIHFDDAVAERAGLPGVVAHGMLTMGLGADYVTDWLGDPGAMRKYTVRFTSPVVVPADAPAEVEFTGKIKSVDEAEGTAVVAITATSEGKKIFGRATATVRLAR